jgi:hypothetical protein
MAFPPETHFGFAGPLATRTCSHPPAEIPLLHRPIATPMPIYQLSNEQKKELLIKGRSVQIALPTPHEEPEDLVEWARSVLPRDLQPLVRTAELELVEVRPNLGTRRNTLTELLGEIISDIPEDEDDDRPQPEELTIWMDVCVITLAGNVPRDPDGQPLPPQWPLDVQLGRKLLLGNYAP